MIWAPSSALSISLASRHICASLLIQLTVCRVFISRAWQSLRCCCYVAEYVSDAAKVMHQ